MRPNPPHHQAHPPPHLRIYPHPQHRKIKIVIIISTNKITPTHIQVVAISLTDGIILESSKEYAPKKEETRNEEERKNNIPEREI